MNNLIIVIICFILGLICSYIQVVEGSKINRNNFIYIVFGIILFYASWFTFGYFLIELLKML